MTDIPVMLTPAQVSDRLGVSVKFVYELCDSTELGHNRFGRRIGIPETEVDAYLARTFVPAKSKASKGHRLRPVQVG